MDFQPKALIEATLEAHQKSNDYMAWEESPWHPNVWLNNLPTNLEQREIFLNELCDELSKLEQKDLNIIYPALSYWAMENVFKCIEEQLFKIEYELLNQSVKLKDSKFGVQIQNQKSEFKLGPSREHKIDTTDGPIFNYGSRGNLESKELALTFDDGPHPRLTLELLDILKSEEVQVTFFTVGKNIKTYPELARLIVAENHTLGTHSQTHRNLPKLKAIEAIEDIEMAFQMAIDHVGMVSPFFRFPFGSKNQNLTTHVKSSGYGNFFWDIDTLDWKKTQPKELLEFTLNQIESTGKGIVLFHDIQPQTIVIMPTLLEALKRNGYKLVVYRAEKDLQETSFKNPLLRNLNIF